MRYWQYRAYNASGLIVDGVVTGDNHLQVILGLRQQGLQVFDLVTITRAKYREQQRANAIIGDRQFRDRINLGGHPFRKSPIYWFVRYPDFSRLVKMYPPAWFSLLVALACLIVMAVMLMHG